MRWQKIARFAIVLFVVGFAAMVFLAMRKRSGPPPVAEDVRRADPAAIAESESGEYTSSKEGKVVLSIKYTRQLLYSDGTSRLKGITLVLPDRDGKTFTVTADDAEVATAADQKQSLRLGKLVGNVKLMTNSGLTVTAGEATYDEKEGIVKVPGAVQFTRARMTGTGVGATYDRNRDVLWILAQAHVTIAADASGGGALDATAGNAGLARADNYVKLVGNAKVLADGRTAEAAEITGLLDETGEKIQQLQLREQSKITGNGSGAQLMTARHIDMTYAADGRTLQFSKLMEGAVVELPGAAGAGASRIAGATIDIAMSPDGATVTNLTAQQKVQVDLPADGDLPAKRILATSLTSVGAPGTGLQNAVFEGPVDYTETRAASAKGPAIDRRAKSVRLIVDTKPGLGPVERADFHGNVHFVDGEMSADAPRAVYSIAKDDLELTPSPGDPGPGPILNNHQFTVQARNIHVSPSTQKLKADTDVRSIIKPQQAQPAGAAPATSGGRAAAAPAPPPTRVPAMLKQDKPVNVTSNRLEYDGKAEATYSGNALLWQDQSRINGDTLVMNDETGNLSAKINVRTTMILEDEDPKTKVKKASETKVTADAMVYDDAKRLATYTSTTDTLARLVSSQGDMSGKRIDLYLREGGNELDRAEADDTASVKLEKMHAAGKHLVYTAADDKYVMTGEPVVSVQKDDEGKCKQTKGTILTYLRAIDSIHGEGMPGLVPFETKPIDPCPAEVRH